MMLLKKTKTSFSEMVWKVVEDIPKGHVMTYASVATQAGFPGAARAVGTLMKKNRNTARPCHRVICSDGRVGQFNRGSRQKVKLLTQEGIVIQNGRLASRTHM